MGVVPAGSGGSGCMFCGRRTYDPDKRERPWSRGVTGGRQVLICPACQLARPEWATALDACGRCGSTRLSVMLGEVTCRQCGWIAGLEAEGSLIE